MRRTHALGRTSLLILVAMGCTSSGTDPESTAIAITVGPGTTPVYSWSGGNLWSLYVTRVDSPSVVIWGINTDCCRDAIPSPTTHGTVPTGTTQHPSPQIVLTEGVTYTVYASRLYGGTGVRLFTP